MITSETQEFVSKTFDTILKFLNETCCTSFVDDKTDVVNSKIRRTLEVVHKDMEPAVQIVLKFNSQCTCGMFYAKTITRTFIFRDSESAYQAANFTRAAIYLLMQKECIHITELVGFLLTDRLDTMGAGKFMNGSV